jgi:Uma2 family endonuclease
MTETDFMRREITMATIAKLTLKEYERIVATGVFDGLKKRRIELIRGELREMSPIGPNHCDIVDWLNVWSVKNGGDGTFRVRVQEPVAFETVDSEPEPDVVWAKPKRYSDAHPTPDEILLLIEVADSSLENDRGEKAEVYADVGIQDYWIVNLVDRTVEVRREPRGGQYQDTRSYGLDESVEPLLVSGPILSVAEMFGPSR